VGTVQGDGLKGLKNGELLSAAELAGYDVLLTVDQSIPRQQASGGRNLSILIIRSRTNRVEDLLPFVGSLMEALKVIAPGQITSVGVSGHNNGRESDGPTSAPGHVAMRRRACVASRCIKRYRGQRLGPVDQVRRCCRAGAITRA